MRLVAQLVPALAFALAVAACGEDVNFESGRDAAPPLPSPLVDASLPAFDAAVEAGTRLRDSAPGGGAVFDSPFDPRRFLEAGCFPPGVSPFGCHADGLTCRTAKDCCSDRCEQGYCLGVGTCAAPGAPCNTRSDCCSERCEPNTRTGALECAQYCMADGSHCREASDCCSIGCNGGLCGGPICETEGTPCTADATCCSGRCGGPSGCAPTMAACLPSGEGCDADGGVQCCSGACNTKTGRCDLGQGTCREPSTPCTAKRDCCRGDCTSNPQDPRSGMVCTSMCLPDGKECNSNGDCCGMTCTGLPTLCKTPPPVCP